MKKSEGISQMTNLKSMYLSNNINTENQSNTSIFFGTGLASTTAPSLGFGIDVLSTILTALEVKRKLGAKNVLHLISTTGYNVSESTRDELIEKQKGVINTIVSNLGISSEYKMICSNDFIGTEKFKEIYNSVKVKLEDFYELENFESFGDYTILQTSICRYLYETENASVKIGWTTKDNEREEKVSRESVEELIESAHLNEFYFDEIYRYVYPENECSYIYTPPAIGLDGRCSPPYTVTQNDTRPLIDENICNYYHKYIEQMKTSRDSKKKLKKSIENLQKTIVEPYEKLFGKIAINCTENTCEELLISVMKVAKIQEKVLREIIVNNNTKNNKTEER